MQLTGKSKIKVVWLCPYPVDKLLSETAFVRRKKYHPAPWIVNSINVLKDIPEIELHVITLNAHIRKDIIIDSDSVKYYILKRGIKILSLGYPKHFRFDLFTSFYIETQRLKKILNLINPDLIHSFGSEVPYGIASLRSGFKYIFSLQGIMLKMSELFPYSLNYKLMGKIERKTIKGCGYFMSQSTAVTDHIFSLNPSAKVFKTYYPVDNCFFEVKPIQKKTYDLVFVGNILDKNKGFIIFFEGLRKLYIKGIKLKVAIIGNKKNDYLKLLSDLGIDNELYSSIVFHGYLTHEQIASVYSETKVLVIPSLIESYSMTAAEGLASEICVIASNVGGLLDLIDHHSNGLFFNSGDHLDLSSKIEEVLSDEKFREILAKNARNSAFNRFNKDIVAHNHLKAYQSVLG